MPTVRDRIMDHLIARFEAIQEGVDGYNHTWNWIAREPVPAQTMGHVDAFLFLFDSKERKRDDIGYTRCTLQIIVEFNARRPEASGASKVLNSMLGDVQRAMLSDTNCGGLAIDMSETGSDLDLEGSGDKLSTGVVLFEVTYRHKTGDPFRTLGE